MNAALSNVDNDEIMKIVGWDIQRNLVKQIDKPGARYIWKITYDPTSQKVTFTGQSRSSVSATLDEISVRPSVAHLQSSLGPVLPYTLAYGSAEPNKYPVIKCGTYTFWPTTYKDGRDKLCVVVADQENIIQQLIDCPGTQLIRDIEIDDVARKIVLYGWDGAEASLDYETAMACYYRDYTITPDDFLFISKFLCLSLTEGGVEDLASLMPHINSALCSPMEGTYEHEGVSVQVGRHDDDDTFPIGPFLGGFFGGLGGFLVGGSRAIDFGYNAGSTAEADFRSRMHSSRDIGDYELSYWEKESSLVG
jgi:hypothetical protein